jgi:hypothetical protein
MNTTKGIKGFVSVPVVARFWSKVAVASDNDCWLWRGAHDQHGRGQMWLNGRNEKAPRIAWLIQHGMLPPITLQVCHSCDVPACVNPKHLWLGTMKENIQDARRKGRIIMWHERGAETWQGKKLFCIRGHPFSAENTMVARNGHRRCRECQRNHQRKYYASLKRRHPALAATEVQS